MRRHKGLEGGRNLGCAAGCFAAPRSYYCTPGRNTNRARCAHVHTLLASTKSLADRTVYRTLSVSAESLCSVVKEVFRSFDSVEVVMTQLRNIYVSSITE